MAHAENQQKYMSKRKAAGYKQLRVELDPDLAKRFMQGQGEEKDSVFARKAIAHYLDHLGVKIQDDLFSQGGAETG